MMDWIFSEKDDNRITFLFVLYSFPYDLLVLQGSIAILYIISSKFRLLMCEPIFWALSWKFNILCFYAILKQNNKICFVKVFTISFLAGALIKLLWSQMLRTKVKTSPIHGGFALWHRWRNWRFWPACFQSGHLELYFLLFMLKCHHCLWNKEKWWTEL